MSFHTAIMNNGKTFPLQRSSSVTKICLKLMKTFVVKISHFSQSLCESSPESIVCDNITLTFRLQKNSTEV